MSTVSAALRVDVRVGNEATGLVLTSGCRNGKSTQAFQKEGGPKWKEAVEDGSIVPMQLVQDDGFDVRIVAHDALSPQEQAEWVDRLSWKLSIPDGQLMIVGGAGYLRGDGDERFDVAVDVEPGQYRVDLYTYLYSINGPGCLAKAGVRESSLKRYYEQTRPGEPMPLRVHRLLGTETASDLAREEVKQRVQAAADASWRYVPGPEDAIPEREEPEEAVQFLVHLTPLADAPVDKVPVSRRGWFEPVQSPRKPERFPLGLVSTAAPHTAPVHVERALAPARMFSMPAMPIEGGPVDLPMPEALGLVCWLALFCHREVSPQVRVRNAGAFPAASLACREDLLVQQDEPGGFMVHCLQWQTNAIPRMHLLASKLGTLPDGAVIDVATGPAREPGGHAPSQDEAIDPAAPPKPGMHRYRGTVSRGVWSIADAWPPIDAARLRTALQVAEDIDLGRPVTLPDAATAMAVIDAMSENAFDYRDRKRRGAPLPEVHGAAITLPPDRWFQSFEVGAFVLRQLLPEAWPYKRLEDKPLWPFG